MPIYAKCGHIACSLMIPTRTKLETAERAKESLPLVAFSSTRSKLLIARIVN
jgi:hypothetical protein